MRRLPADVLEDPAYRMPAVAAGPAGLTWLRTHVPRFCDGDRHAHLRPLSVAVIEGIADAPFVDDPTRSLLRALALPDDLAADVALVAAGYQPHAPQSGAADAAADRLIAACGGRTDEAAARVGVLVQAHPAVPALVDRLRSGSTAPPVPVTRRRAPDGTAVEVDLAAAPFGRGAHRCPGEALAQRLAAAALED